MKKIYRTICDKLSCKDSGFTIKWIPKKKNSIAHYHSYLAFKKLKIFPEKSELLVIDKTVFFDMLMNCDERHVKIITLLYNASNNQKIICMTQIQMAESLKMSISFINKFLSQNNKM